MIIRDIAQKVENIIKRVNERRMEIVRAVDKGTIPRGVLKNWDVAFDMAASEAGVNRTKSGSLPHGKYAQEHLDPYALQNLLDKSTAGQIKRDIERGITQEFGEDASPEEIEQYTDDMSYVYTQLSEEYDETYDALDAKFRGTKGKKSYKQLREAIEEWKDLTDRQKKYRLTRAKKRGDNAVDRMFT